MSAIAVLQAVAAIGLLAVADASPSKRIAVLIVPTAPEDGELADNLGEVAISQLADRGQGELVGTRELRRFLERDEAGPGAVGCARDTDCLRRIATALTIDKIVVGTLRRTKGGFVVEVVLVDPASGAAERQVERSADMGVESLVGATQDAIEALFTSAPPSVPLRVPSETSSASAMVDQRSPDQPRRRWAPPVAFGSAAAAALAFAGAGVFGTLAAADPSGPTRASAQRDLQLRNDYAATANVLLVVGAAFAAVSTAVFVLLRRDVSGE